VSGNSTLKVFFSLLLGYAIGLTLQNISSASRAAGGTYSLPAGNPVSTATTITSTWANNTLSDLATEMTDSLSRSGKGAMLAPLRATNGTVSAPSLTFDSDQDLGIYRVGVNTLGLTCGNSSCATIASTGLTVPVGISVSNSNASSNGITATGGANANGGTFTGGTGDTHGILSTGQGAGYGGDFSSAGSGFGIATTGNATGAPIKIVPQSATPSSTDEGQVYYDSDTDTFYGYASGGWAGMSWIRGSHTVDLVAVPAGECGDVTGITVTGASATAGSHCILTLPSDGATGGLIGACFVTGANTVTLRFCCNNGASTCDPASKTYRIAVLNP